jgi:Polyketide cyclase / dehydrase and lipid transport
VQISSKDRHAAVRASVAAFITGTLLLSFPAMANEPLSRTDHFHLAASCERAFPLFTALGEKQWAEGWQPKILSGSERRGSVFSTQHAHGHVTTWIVTDYDPTASRVSYARLVEGSNMGLVDVRCSRDGDGSAIEVTYTLTGLNADGDALVAEFLSETHYSAMMLEWQRAVTTALTAQK